MAEPPERMVGDWKLHSLLGRGGNAEVWAASRNEGPMIALKVLGALQTDSERFRRFRLEIGVLQRLGEFHGVLPLIEFNLPDSPSRRDPAWLAMPIAEGITNALSKHEGLQGVRMAVEAVEQISRTLGTLASSHRIFHRDVKPDNMYRWNDDWYIGDFGLVDDPLGEAFTEPGRLLGPKHYLAPEVFAGGDYDSGPVDVYALAKSLWVLITRQNYPQPGQLSADDNGSRLGSFVVEGNLRPVELLLSRSTQLDPSKRPTMEQFNAELRAWLDPTSVQNDRALALSSMSARVKQLVQTQSELFNRSIAQQQHVRSTLSAIAPMLGEIGADLEMASGLVPVFGAHSELSELREVQQMHASRESHHGHHDAVITLPVTASASRNGRISLVAGFAMSATSADAVHMRVLLGLHSGGKYTTVWWKEQTAVRGSALESSIRAELLSALRSALPIGLEAFAATIDTEKR